MTATLYDDDGTEIPLDVQPVTATSVTLTATVEPGASYRLRVTQPPTSVIFAYDTSFSIGTLETAVYQALIRFAGDVLPGHEYVNVIPFGEQLLMDDWSDDPYYLQGVIAGYPRTATSSDAEGALVIANEALAERPGTHAIFLISDAENNPSFDTHGRSLAGPGDGRAARVRRADRGRRHLRRASPGPDAGLGAGQQRPLRLRSLARASSTSPSTGRRPSCGGPRSTPIGRDRAAGAHANPGTNGHAGTDADAGTNATPAPTATPEPTATPLPTATPFPHTPEPTPTPESTATPAPDGSLSVLAPTSDDGQVLHPAGRGIGQCRDHPRYLRLQCSRNWRERHAPRSPRPP